MSVEPPIHVSWDPHGLSQEWILWKAAQLNDGVPVGEESKLHHLATLAGARLIAETMEGWRGEAQDISIVKMDPRPDTPYTITLTREPRPKHEKRFVRNDTDGTPLYAYPNGPLTREPPPEPHLKLVPKSE